MVGKLNNFAVVIELNSNGVIGCFKHGAEGTIDETPKRIINHRHDASPNGVVELIRPRKGSLVCVSRAGSHT